MRQGVSQAKRDALLKQKIEDGPEELKEFNLKSKNRIQKYKNFFDELNEIVSGQGENMDKKAKGGLAEATAKLKAKGFKDGGMVVKEKVVAIDKSPNSGLITTKGFGAGRRT